MQAKSCCVVSSRKKRSFALRDSRVGKRTTRVAALRRSSQQSACQNGRPTSIGNMSGLNWLLDGPPGESDLSDSAAAQSPDLALPPVRRQDALRTCLGLRELIGPPILPCPRGRMHAPPCSPSSNESRVHVQVDRIMMDYLTVVCTLAGLILLGFPILVLVSRCGTWVVGCVGHGGWVWV